jgi:dsRNA-specific ribonuclease
LEESGEEMNNSVSYEVLCKKFSQYSEDQINKIRDKMIEDYIAKMKSHETSLEIRFKLAVKELDISWVEGFKILKSGRVKK